MTEENIPTAEPEKIRHGITARQKAALDFIRLFIAEKGYSPTYTEIAEGMGLKSKANAHGLVNELVYRNRLHMIPNKARSISLVWATNQEGNTK